MHNRESDEERQAVKLLQTERESELKSFPHVKQSSIDPVATLRFMALKPSRKVNNHTTRMNWC